MLYRYSPLFRRRLINEVSFVARRYKLTHVANKALKYLDNTIKRSLEVKKYRIEFRAGATIEVPISTVSAAVGSDFTKKGFALIVPGNFASTLDDMNQEFFRRIWMNSIAMMAGRFRDLRLATYSDAQHEHDANSNVEIQATELLQGYYDTLRLNLMLDGFATVDFPFDWRKDVDNNVVAIELKNLIWRLGQNDSGAHRNPFPGVACRSSVHFNF